MTHLISAFIQIRCPLVLYLSLLRFRIIWFLVYSSGGLYLPFRKLLVLSLILSFLETINIYVEHITNKLFTARVCLIIPICFMWFYNTLALSICQYNFLFIFKLFYYYFEISRIIWLFKPFMLLIGPNCLFRGPRVHVFYWTGPWNWQKKVLVV